MNDTDYERHDGLGLAALVRAGEVSAAELLEASWRRVEARNLVMDPVTHAPASSGGFVAVNPYEMVIDRQPPAAELQVGLRWRATRRLLLQGTLYNAFASRRGSYDNANDLEARLELTPMKFESFRFFSSAVVSF